MDPITSLAELATALRRIGRQASGDSLWYRGAGSHTYELTPSLFRHPVRTELEDLLATEANLLIQFRQRAVPFMQNTGFPINEPWECLFLMQHYGVPTRLLDWSENAMVGLWFALHSGNPDHSAVLWVLNPVKWNRQVFSHQSYEGGILSIGDPQLPGYRPLAELGQMNTAPAAMYGTHSSPRIVAQRGVFTIAGKDTRPLDKFTAGFKDPDACLWQLEIEPKHRQGVSDDLRRAGFAESMIFPDLEGLARELRRSEGF